MKDIQAAYEKLTNAEKSEIVIVSTGCPFKTIYELQEVAKLLQGKKVKDGVLFFVHTELKPSGCWPAKESPDIVSAR